MNRLIHDASELRKLIAENPDLPIVVLVNEEVVADSDYVWWYSNSVKCDIGFMLDVDTTIYSDSIYTSEDELEDDIREHMYDNLSDYFGDFDDDWEPTDECAESRLKEEMKKYEPYWKKVIRVWCDN